MTALHTMLANAHWHLALTLLGLPLLTEFSGGILAGVLADPLYGVGAPRLMRFLPWIHHNDQHDVLDTGAGRNILDSHTGEESTPPKSPSSGRSWRLWKRPGSTARDNGALPSDSSPSPSPQGAMQQARHQERV